MKLTRAQEKLLEAIRATPKYDSDHAEVAVTGAQKLTARNLRNLGLVWIDAPDGALGPFYVSLTKRGESEAGGWSVTAGLTPAKERRHGGRYLCPFHAPVYERGGPSGVVLRRVPSPAKDEPPRVCMICGEEPR